MYARTKGWELGEVTVDVDYDPASVRFAADIRLAGDLTDVQLERLERVAAACPVGRALAAGAELEERLSLRTPAAEAA